MSAHFVDANTATPLRRQIGSQVTLVNQLAVDVYFERNENRINATAPGVVPNGIKLSATNGSIQIDNFPGVIWTRAVSATTIEVYP